MSLDFITLAESLGMDLGDPPQVDEARCLNHRAHWRRCTLCQEACPARAITVTQADPLRGIRPRVTLDPALCARCGLCLHLCPSEVFTHPARAETLRWWVEGITEHATESLELACPLNAGTPTPAPVTHRFQLGQCLAALSLGTLLDMMRPRNTDLWLNDTQCAHCPLAPAHESITQVVQQVNHLLTTWGHPARVRVITQDSGDTSGAPHPVTEVTARSLAITRRELFQLFRQWATRAATTIAEEALATPPPDPSTIPPEQRLPYHVPFHRRHTTAALRRLGPPQSTVIDLEALPWAAVHVEGTCSACGLCARYCPTTALRFYTWQDETGTSRFGLVLHPAYCVDCGICALICPEQAITYGTRMYTEWLTSDEAALLHEGQLTPCADCGMLTAQRPVSLCYVCAEKRRREAKISARSRELPDNPPE